MSSKIQLTQEQYEVYGDLKDAIEKKKNDDFIEKFNEVYEKNNKSYNELKNIKCKSIN